MINLKVVGALVLAAHVVGCTDQPVDESESVAVSMLSQNAALPNNFPIFNESGIATTVSSHGRVELGNEFFQDLGSNGRRCVSCHLPTSGWGITPTQVREIFALTNGGAIDDGFGLGAIFRTNDGANSPIAEVATLEQRRAAYSMLLSKGLIRVGLPIPANAEFELVAVDDPYHFASAAELSLFRRPLPTTNFKFLSTVMWDGRETVPGATIHFDLSVQSDDATTGHAQGDHITDAQRASIVDFELGLVSAQIYDQSAKSLSGSGATGGTGGIEDQEFHIGINDNFGDCIDAACMVIGAPLGTGVRGAAFSPIVFDLYDAWANLPKISGTATARRAVARGQQLFNTRAITISGVSGLNDEAAFGRPASLVGTCTTCHDTPNSGNHSVVAPLNIGLVDEAVRTPDMPLYTLRNKTTGDIKKVTDPGRALISGKWAHVGRFKGPILRGLSGRAPYFHNGFAANLGAVVDFYNTRFNMSLTSAERSDLVAFLKTL